MEQEKHLNSPAASGFNLIEILVVLMVMGVLISLATPNLSAWIDKQRGKDTLETLSGVIYYARSEAIKRNQQVSVCAVGDKNQCGNNWSAGFLVAVSDTVLRSYPAVKGRLVWNAANPQNPLVFLPTGFTNFQMGSFYYCSAAAMKDNNAMALRLIINQNGRPRMANEHDGTKSCAEL